MAERNKYLNQLAVMGTTCGERRLISIRNPSIYLMDHENVIGLNRVKYIVLFGY